MSPGIEATVCMKLHRIQLRYSCHGPTWHLVRILFVRYFHEYNLRKAMLTDSMLLRGGFPQYRRTAAQSLWLAHCQFADQGKQSVHC